MIRGAFPNSAPAPSPQRLLIFLAISTALAGAVGFAALTFPRWLPAAAWHLLFAVSALPLILSAMGYFVPVLTRTAGAGKGLAALPGAALLAGIGIAAHFLTGNETLRLFSPWLALAAVAGFGAWMAGRGRACLGRPNPCLAWYMAALGLLGIGLLAVGISPWLPEQQSALRAIHIHLNTLGFMGLTALGTLQVLIPTVAGRPDPEAGTRLVRDLKWSAGGALAIALGAAVFAPLAVLGALAYAWPVVALFAGLRRAYGADLWLPGRTAPLLLSAVAGLVMVLGHGLLHLAGPLGGRGVLPLFAIAFLVPLVSGAAGQLLPVWLRPGPQGPWHHRQRERLAYGARLRAALLPVGGALASAGLPAGYGIGAFCAAWLAVSMVAVALDRKASL